MRGAGSKGCETMLREISEEVRVNIKDRLREVRHAIRQHRHDSGARLRANTRAPFPLNGIEGLLSHAASAFDDAMTMAETLVPRGRIGGRSAIAAPRPFGTYFATRDRLAGERAFRRDLYALTKGALAARRFEGVRIHESSFAAIHAAMARNEADALAELARDRAWTERVALVAGLSASLLLELLRHEPLRSGEAAAPDRPTVVACLAPVALACGLATMEANEPPQSDLLEIAMLAIDARLDRVLDALGSDDPRRELTAILAALLAHLP